MSMTVLQTHALMVNLVQIKSMDLRVRVMVGTHVNQVSGGFKTQPPVDRRLRPVPGGCHCLEQ